MAEGLTFDLVFVALCIGLIAVALSCRVVAFQLALVIVGLRLLVPIVYFAWLNDGSWNSLDDMSYFEWGFRLYDSEFDPFRILFFTEGLSLLFEVSGGPHIIYPWWNMLAIYLFGEHYYSPVFLNVGLSFVTAYFLNRILVLAEFEKKYRQTFYAFFLLHWDIIAWSSFVNLKDTLLTAMAVINFWLLCSFFMKKTKAGAFYILGLGVAISAFFWIRFYVPLLILSAVGIWLTFSNPRKIIYWILVCCMITYAGAHQYFFQGNWEMLSFSNLVMGPLHAALSPRPWSIDDVYSFLFIPAVIHWMLLVPALIGASLLWKRSKLARLFIIYLVLVFFFSAVVPDLSGPRHRYHVAFILALMQFQFFWKCFFNRHSDQDKYRVTFPKMPGSDIFAPMKEN